MRQESHDMAEQNRLAADLTGRTADLPVGISAEVRGTGRRRPGSRRPGDNPLYHPIDAGARRR